MLLPRTRDNSQPVSSGPRPRSGRPDRLKPRRRTVLEFDRMEGRALLSTFTVSNALDSGAGSLRQAIVDARDGDTINFDASLSGRAIVLTSGELDIDEDLDIVGLGSDQMAVAGDGDGRVFHITAGADVTIEDLAIINGRADVGG